MASFEFEELVGRYTGLITSNIVSKLTDREHVKDVKQEVLLNLFLKYEKGDFDSNDKYKNDIDSLSVIIKRVTRDCTVNYIRQLNSLASSFITNAVSDTHLSNVVAPDLSDDRSEHLNKMLEEYSDEVNQVVELRRQGLSFKEISRITGTGVGYLKVIMSRTILKLRETAQAEQE